MGAVAFAAVGCRRSEPAETLIYPDYGKDLVLPCNIAPLNFHIGDNGTRHHHVRIDVCDSMGMAKPSPSA